ncbi:LpqB family beta-propeller domain-containing protein [Spirillospora sp. NPDC127200]
MTARRASEAPFGPEHGPVPGDGREPRTRRVPAALAAVAALAIGAVGCANVPTSGRVVSGKAVERADQVDDPYVRLIPVPPKASWAPEQVVSGFLAASGSFDDKQRVARSYLAKPGAWTPGPRPSVTVFKDRLQPVMVRQNAAQATVRVEGEQLGAIRADGQYVADPKKVAVTFDLAKTPQAGWRIAGLSGDAGARLLLTKSDVERAFRTVDLYFFGPDRSALVPNGIFLPLVDRQSLPAQLVQALLGGPTSWLRDAVRSEFPAGTELRGVTVDNKIATVELSGQAASGDLRRMSAQLSWTLRQLSEIRYWKLRIDGEDYTPDGMGDTQPVSRSWEEYAPDGPPDRHNGEAYAMGLAGDLSRLAGDRPQPVMTNDAGRLSRPAVSPDGREAAGLSRKHDQVLVTDLTGDQRLRPLLTGRSRHSRFTAPAFDRNGRLWTVESSADKSWLWVRERGGPPVQVKVWGLGGRQVLAFQVARDGVRAAVIVRIDGKNQVQLGRIIRAPDGALDVGSFLPVSSELPDARDLSWRDYGSLAVLGRKELDETVLPYLMPVGGGAITPLGGGVLDSARTIAASPGAPVLIGTRTSEGPRVCRQRNPREQFSEWTCSIPATDPTYPN